MRGVRLDCPLKRGQAKDEQSRRTKRKQQTTGAEDGHKDDGSEFTKPSLFEPRNKCGVDYGDGSASLSPAVGSAGQARQWARQPSQACY